MTEADAGYIRQTLGQLLEGQKGLQTDVAIIRVEHQKTREMVVANRAGARALTWVGGGAITLGVAFMAYWRG